MGRFQSSWRVRSLLGLLFMAVTVAAAAVGGNAAPAADPKSVTLSPESAVTVTGGQIRGEVPDAHPDIIAFKGVPFAAPPVGELRWRPPAPVVAWQGVRSATASGSACAQRGPGTQNEDCLFLNVWAPRKITRPLPVMVWIHGGGFRIGNGGSTDGAPLASKGVVLVTVNYRLGVFGFFPHPALTAESGRRASGNQGLLDMVAALEWVRANIASFGGDPKRVTIFGESAGGGAVAALMLVPQAKGLFHRAIAESPYVHGWDRPLSTRAREWAPAEEVGLELGKALGATGNDALAVLRGKTTAEVLKASDEGPLFRWSGTIWAPNVDGRVIPDDPVAMYNAGKQHRVPLIAGINDNEGSLFRSRFNISDVNAFESYVRRDFASIAPETLAQYGVKSPDAVAAGLDHLVHDMFFAGPARLQMRAHAKVSSPAWLYHFAQVPPNQQGKNFGAHHAAEIAYVFGELAPSTPWTDADRQVSALMMNYWTQFAATGNPNRDGLPDWLRFDKANDTYLTLAAAPKSGTQLHRDAETVYDRFESQRRSRSRSN
jgi:para-nitrobenzyl esterase